LGCHARAVVGAEREITESKAIVSQYKNVFDAVPRRTPASHAVDGPVLGNGDMGIAIGGAPKQQWFYLHKNDMWRLKHKYGHSSPVPFGRLGLNVPALQDASYSVVQDLYTATTHGTFQSKDVSVKMRSYVAATENLFVLEMQSQGKPVDVTAVLHAYSGRGSDTRAGRLPGIPGCWGKRAFVDNVDLPSGCSAAFKLLGAKGVAAFQEDAKPATKQTFNVQLGREQHGRGRWGLKGRLGELKVYEQALTPQTVKTATPLLAIDTRTVPDGASSVESEDGALLFEGDGFVNLGSVAMPVSPVTVACRLNFDSIDEVANYVLSCGEWNRGVSLGLSSGKLRFSINGNHVHTPVLKTRTWYDVVASYDGSAMVVYIDGEVAARQSGKPAPAMGTFTLRPGEPVTIVLAMDSVFRSEDYVEAVKAAIVAVDAVKLSKVRRAHLGWWANYWAKSYVDIDNPVIEHQYYRSLYGLGSISRNLGFPPAIFGWATGDKPLWAGDYHLNYNHQAPFYGLARANRLEQADPHDTPILEFLERARWHCKEIFGYEGAMFPVGIGPRGIETTYDSHYVSWGPTSCENRGLFCGQRTNGSYALVNVASRWYTTYDHGYARKLYPLLLSTATFWENYMTWEALDRPRDGKAGRYIIDRDSVHEGSGQDLNSCVSIGLSRNALLLALDMSKALNRDADRRAKWEHMLEHLSGYTTQEIKGKTVFRYTEKGTAWWRDNTLGIQQVYPAGQIHLDSDPELRQVARNTIEVMQRWIDKNGSNSFFPAAVRIGYSPDEILKQLVRYSEHTYPNGFQAGNPHGIENFSTVHNTVNEMLCMGHKGVIRLFPVWPKGRDARFVNIRCWGAFLVSSELKGGEVQQVTIHSERGRDCTLVNPWPGENARLLRSGRVAEVLSGRRFVFRTQPGETMEVRRSGV